MKVLRGPALLLMAWISGGPIGAQTPGLVPIDDLGLGTYFGFQGGLYSGGSNQAPLPHRDRAMDLAAQVRPLDALGVPDPLHGAVVMVAVGMSNANQEFAVFERQEDAGNERNARLVLVDGAVGGQDATILANPAAPYWSGLSSRIAAMGLTPEQVQVVWLKEDVPGAVPGFPADALNLRGYLVSIVQILHDRFVNLKLCYLSSRIYGGYGGSGEPKAYDTGFAVKWLIEDQIAGDPALNDGRAPGPVEAPLLLWGPYLWANGPTPRSDGLMWLASDLESDNTHPGPGAEQKVADLLSTFFDSEGTAAAWWPRVRSAALLPIDAEKDTYVDAAATSSNFGGALRLNTSGGTFPARTFLGFARPPIGASVDFAKLSLRVPTDVQGGGTVFTVSDTSWSELGMTWNVAPPIGGALASVPQTSRDGVIAASVTATVNADVDGLLSFAITTPATTPTSYTSREAGQPPRLILTIPCGGPSGLPDGDGDGASDPCDCAPGDSSAIAVPAEVTNLRWPDASSLSWDSGAVLSGSGTVYDMVSGMLDDAASLWPAASDLCVTSGSVSTTTLDTTPQLLSGSGRYFLVRGRNGCGAGRFETASSGRDRVSAACP